jgi:hypothetical protein
MNATRSNVSTSLLLAEGRFRTKGNAEFRLQRLREQFCRAPWSGRLAPAAQLHLIRLLGQTLTQRLGGSVPVIVLGELRDPGVERAPADPATNRALKQ